MRKWLDRRHWQFEADLLGEDTWGVWLVVPEGRPAQRGDELPISLPSGFISLVPRNQWWMAEFYPNSSVQEIYVNIGTPGDWDDHRLISIDLDLDVIRKPNGTVEVLDEHEFSAHQTLLAYPSAVVRTARVTVDRIGHALARHDEPFGSAMRSWFELAQL